MSLIRRTLLLLPCAVVFCSAALAMPAEEPHPTLAVLYFDYSGKNEEIAALGKGLAQMLISDLSREDTPRVVERERLEAILQEQKLAASGKLDPKTAAKVGRLLGARCLVLGGYFDLGKVLRVDARVVDVETGRVLGSVGANGRPDEFLGVEQEVAQGLLRVLARVQPACSGPSGAGASGGGEAPATRPPRRPKVPARLRTRTAITYGKALSAIDQGNKSVARQLLQQVVQDQTDFDLAVRDLDKLIQ